MSGFDTGQYVTRIPADVDREDTILAGLSARQLAILASAGALVWLAFMATGDHVPLPVFAVFSIPVLAVAAAFAFVRRDGISLDRLVCAALRQARSPRHMVDAPEGVRPVPAWVNAPSAPLPAPLRLPAQAISAEGVVDLGSDGAAVIVGCGTVSFALRTPDEQLALVAGFARYLNSLSGPTQILVRAERVNLTPAVSSLYEAAPALPHPALEQAALDHASFLEELAATRDLLYRQVLLVVREPHTRDEHPTAERVRRRAEEAVRHLTAAGIAAAVLDGPSTAGALASAVDPSTPPPPAGTVSPDTLITAQREVPR